MSSGHYLSPKEIQKAVLDASISHPLTLYPVIGGVLGATGTVVIAPSVTGIVLATVVGLAGVGHGLFQIFAGATRVEQEIYRRYQEKMEEKQRTILKHLESDLNDVGSSEGVRQLRKLNEKFEIFRALLGKKLSPGELTYSRYMNRATTVYNATLDNLEEIANNLKAISAINIQEIDEKLDQISGSSLTGDNSPVRETLDHRKSLYNSRLQRVNELYGANESALTLIDVSAVELASITTSALEELDLQEAML